MKIHAGRLASILATACLLSCQQQGPVAALKASAQTLVLPYPHRVSLELTWLPLKPVGDSSGSPTVLVHLVDREGRVRRTFDHPFPDAWTAGSEVTYPLHLDQSAVAPPLPPGTYDLTLGLSTEPGRRWPLEVGEPEVDDQRGVDEREYALAEVTIPHPVAPTTRFELSGGWTAPQDAGARQVVATRWLGDGEAEVAIWGHDRSGEAVLSFSIPRLQEPEHRLRAGAGVTAPAVAVESECGRVSGGLSGYGSHEIRVAVTASGADRKCAVRFSPSAYFLDSEGSETFSALLESAVWVPAAGDSRGSEPARRHRLTRSPERLEVSLPQPATPETFVLRNVGDEIVAGPRLTVNGRKDWFSIDSVLAEIVGPGDSDRQKALAIWEFLVANRHHDFPAFHRLEPHDPVRLLNVYGYGYCDDAAESFVQLATAAGLRARIWHLGDHVVSEAFYDGGWHMFDADGEVFYVSEDGKTIAGVEQLSSHPGWIRRRPSVQPLYVDTENLVELYTSREDNWIDQRSTAPGRRHVMSFDLRPGESILRSRQNWGLHVVSRDRKEPVAYGNGRFLFEPVWRDDLFRKGAAEVTNVQVGSQGEDRRYLVFAADGDEPASRLAYDFILPYPFLSARVRIVGELSGPGHVELQLSAYGKEWSRAWASSRAGAVDVEVSLDEFFPRDNRRPVYWYSLRMDYAPQAEGSRWRVETLRFESDFQVAPHSLPSFDAGSNEVLYLDAGEGEREIELIFGSGVDLL